MVSGLFFGFYYGWLDDVQLVALYSGLFTPEKLPGPDHHILIAHLFIGLYNLAPNIPWYGIFHHLVLALGILLLNYHLFCNFKNKHGSKVFSILVIACFQLIFFVEMVSFFNFTYISMFIAGIGLYASLVSLNKATRYIGIFLLILGILIRIEVALFILPFIVLQLLLDNRSNILSKKTILPLIAILISSSITIYIKANPTQESLRFLIKNNPVILSIHEAKNVEMQAENAIDSIKLEALTSWNFFDKYSIDEAFLNRVSDGYMSKSILSKYNSLSKIKQQLQAAYRNSSRYPDNYSGYNWDEKFFVLLYTFFTILFIVVLAANKALRKKTRNVFLTLISWLLVLNIVFVILKAEDRIIFPALILFGFFIIKIVLNIDLKSKENKKLSILILITLIFCASFQLNRLSTFAAQKKAELLKKRAIVEEINHKFNSKILLFDFHSIYLIHDTPFKQVRLNKANKYRVAAHYWLLAFDAIQDYYKDLCGSDRIDIIIDYYAERKAEVIYVEHEFNKIILEDYLKIVYDKPYTFEAIEETDSLAISKINYSYISHPLNFNYYYIK